MPKLNRHEVNAIASKLHRKLSSITEENRDKALENYVPSEAYKSIEKLLTAREELVQQIEELDAMRESVERELDSFDHVDIRWGWIRDEQNVKELILDGVKRAECPLGEVPSLETLKDEITIASIDEDFNVVEFIDSELEKWIEK